MNAIWICLIWSVFLQSNVQGDNPLPLESWQGVISPTESSLLNTVAVTQGHYSIITWTYDVILKNYNPRDPHPIIYLHQQPRYWEYFTYRGNCLQLMVYIDQDPRLITLSTRNQNCTLRNQNRDLHCSGMLKQASAGDERWQATIAYECKDTLPPALNVNYIMTLTPYETVTCYDTKDINELYHLPMETRPMTLELSALYDQFSTWNFLAMDNETIREMSTLFPILNSYKSCYQHVVESTLRLVFPECRNGKLVFQCTEMCDDFRAGCDNTDLFSYTKGCAFLNTRALNEPCVYNPVKCLREPVAPENGYVSEKENTSLGANRTFHCNDGYTLVGNTTAFCDYSGNWHIDKYPQCAEKNETIKEVNHTVSVIDNSLVVPLCVAGGFIITSMVIALIVYTQYRYEFLILVFKYCRCLLCCSRFKIKYAEKLYDALIFYYDDDARYVRSHIQEPLEEHGFKLFVDYRDGPLGQSIIRYAPDTIAQSHTVILLVNQRFLDDGECVYLSDQAFYQTLIGEQFRVIIVLMEEQKNLKNIPRYLKGFMATGSNTIQKDDPLLLDKLAYNMPQRQVQHEEVQDRVINIDHHAVRIELQ